MTSKRTADIPNCVALANAQGGAVPTLTAQEEAAQIRHRIAENRKEFWVRAAWHSKALPGAVNVSI